MKRIFFLITVLSLQLSAKELTNQQILDYSSTSNLNVHKSEVIVNNLNAFKAKIEAINQAKKSIDLKYFIFSDDKSSSVFADALLKAAKRISSSVNHDKPVVRMLLDYHTNYKRIDLFYALEKMSEGRIRVKFYNRPTYSILKDFGYLSENCGEIKGNDKKCASVKSNLVQSQQREQVEQGVEKNNMVFGLSDMLAAGIYSKNSLLIKTAILEGQNINLSESSENIPDADQMKQLEELLKLYFEAKIKGSIKAKFKLQMAVLLHGKEVLPVLQTIDKYLPVKLSQSKLRIKNWEFMTDYLHHKLLLVDNKVAILGGRNVEDSYHMQQNSNKYVFMDTDVLLQMSEESGREIQSSFERLWGFIDMVASIKDINKHAHVKYLFAAKKCEQMESFILENAKVKCFKETLAEVNTSIDSWKHLESEILAMTAQKLQINKQAYYDHKQQSNEINFDLGHSAENHILTTYIENVPFKLKEYSRRGSKIIDPEGRTYGSKIGLEATHGKHIHKLWVKALLNACMSDEPKDVILHHSYFFPSSPIIETLE